MSLGRQDWIRLRAVVESARSPFGEDVSLMVRKATPWVDKMLELTTDPVEIPTPFGSVELPAEALLVLPADQPVHVIPEPPRPRKRGRNPH